MNFSFKLTYILVPKHLKISLDLIELLETLPMNDDKDKVSL